MTDPDKEWKDEQKRKKKEQDAKDEKTIKDAQEKKNWERREKAINAAAEQEWIDKMQDDLLDRAFMQLFDIDAKAAAEYLHIAQGADPTDAEVQAAIKAIEAAKKAKEGGIFTSGNPGKAKDIIKKNRTAIKNTIKKGRKAKKGCLGAFAGLAAVGAATAYGMYEGVSAIASALF